MTGPGSAAGSSRQYLVSLRDALASRGVAAEVDDGGWQAQLRICDARPGMPVEDPAESVGVTFAAGGWWFCWPQVTLISRELAGRGVMVAGLTITRWHGVLTLASGPAVRYCHGWLLWPAGRLSRAGRPLCAMHYAADPAGAARRLSPPAPRSGLPGGPPGASDRRARRPQVKIRRTHHEASCGADRG